MKDEVPLLENKDKKDKPTMVAGYRVKDILKSPFKPPKPKKTENKKATKNRFVVFLVVVSTIIALTGVLLVLLNVLLLGVVFLVAAALAVLIAVFLPIR